MLLRNSIKFAILLAAILLTTNLGFAQKKKPAPNRVLTVASEPKATVWLDEVRRGATDDGGKLKIEKVAAGSHVLRIRAAGFAEKTQPVSAIQSGEIKIALVETTDEAELKFQEAEQLRDTGKAAERPAAIAAYRAVIALKPKHLAAHLGLARMLTDANEFDAALETVAAARKIRPNHAETSVIEGRILRSEAYHSDLDGAIKSFRRAIKEAKNFQPEAHTGLALALQEKDEYEAAAAEFKIAIVQLSDTEPVIYKLQGELYARMRRNTEAVAAYENFLRLAPTDREASAVRSIIEQLKKQKNGDLLEIMPQ